MQKLINTMKKLWYGFLFILLFLWAILWFGSLFYSIIITNPIVVISIAIIIVFMCREHKLEKNKETDKTLAIANPSKSFAQKLYRGLFMICTFIFMWWLSPAIVFMFCFLKINPPINHPKNKYIKTPIYEKIWITILLGLIALTLYNGIDILGDDKFSRWRYMDNPNSGFHR